jgi:hypothetical protein
MEFWGAVAVADNVRDKFYAPRLEEVKMMGLRIHQRAREPLSALLGPDGLLEHCPIKRLHVSEDSTQTGPL